MLCVCGCVYLYECLQYVHLCTCVYVDTGTLICHLHLPSHFSLNPSTHTHTHTKRHTHTETHTHTDFKAPSLTLWPRRWFVEQMQPACRLQGRVLRRPGGCGDVLMTLEHHNPAGHHSSPVKILSLCLTLSLCLSMSLSLCESLSLCLSLSLYVSLSVCVSLSLCLCLSLSLSSVVGLLSSLSPSTVSNSFA